MKKIIRKILGIDGKVGTLLIIAIFVVVVCQIASRLLPGNALPWTVEVGQNLLGALIWLGISIGVADGSHVVFDILVKKFKPKTKKVFGLIANTFFIVDMVLIGSFTVTLLKYYRIYDSKTTILGVSMFWVRLPILIGCIWTTLQLIYRQYLLFTKQIEAFPEIWRE